MYKTQNSRAHHKIEDLIPTCPSGAMEKKFMLILGIVILFTNFFIVFMLLKASIPSNNREVLMLSLGIMLGLSTIVVNYYFGSSKGSKDKTEILARHAENNSPYDRHILSEEDDELADSPYSKSATLEE